MKERKNKNIIICIALVVAVVAIFLIFGRNEKNNDTNDKEVKETEQNDVQMKKFIYKEGDTVAKNMFYDLALDYAEFSLDNQVAYGVDYGLGIPDAEKLIMQRTMSAAGTTVLMYGYPNLSPEELGAENAEEARMATQLAIWRIVSADNLEDSLKSEYILDWKNIQSEEEYSEYIDRVIKVADKLVSKAIKTPYYANPEMSIETGESKIVLLNDNMIVGPFTVKGTGYEITEIVVWMENAPESAVICDVQGNEKLEFKNNDEIYIKMAQDVGSINFNLNVKAKGTHYIGEIYGAGETDDEMQDICCMKALEDEITVKTPISMPALTGSIQVTVVDDGDIPIEGMDLQLSNEIGDVIEVLKTDDNGIVVFDNLIVGTYSVQQTSDLENYVVMDMSIQLEVEYDNVSKVKVSNSLIYGSIKVLSVGEDKQNLLSGITYEIIDENKNVIQTLVSDENGEVLFENLEKGVYYIREIAGPKEVCIDSTERKLVIEKPNVLIECSILHYYSKGKISLSLVDQEGAPVKGVEIHIFDADGKIVDTIYTDELGNAISKYLVLGTYYYKQVSVPDEVVIDETRYEVQIVNNFDIVKENVECELK